MLTQGGGKAVPRTAGGGPQAPGPSPVSAIVLDTLTDHLATYPQGPDGLIFTTDKGHAVRRNSFGEMWRKAARAAGLPDGTGMHDLRHFFASVSDSPGPQRQGRPGPPGSRHRAGNPGYLQPPLARRRDRKRIGESFPVCGHQLGR